jgi:hypothetical protein
LLEFDKATRKLCAFHSAALNSSSLAASRAKVPAHPFRQVILAHARDRGVGIYRFRYSGGAIAAWLAIVFLVLFVIMAFRSR